MIMGKYINKIPKVDEDIVDSKEKNIGEQKEKELESIYRDHKEIYFAFIDVLGFKALFNNKDFSEKCEEVFGYYFRTIDQLIKKDLQRTTYAGQTSDSLYFYTDNINILSEYIKYFSHFYLYAMSRNVFFRGGIAKGNLKINREYQFYGKSVINAYLMECSIAKNPIIMIDKSTYDDLKKIDNYKRFKEKYIAGEGRHYINPFSCFENKNMLDDDLQEFDGIISPSKNDIKDNITKGINEFEFDLKNYEKYRFLKEKLEV